MKKRIAVLLLLLTLLTVAGSACSQNVGETYVAQITTMAATTTEQARASTALETTVGTQETTVLASSPTEPESELTVAATTKAAIRSTITGDELQALANNDELKGSLVIVDVRTAEEYNGGHLKNAINISHELIVKSPDILAKWKEKPVYLYCRSGRRSAEVAAALEQAGFVEIYEAPGVTQHNYILVTP